MKKKIISITLIIVIILAIIGVWMIKNNKTQEENTIQTPQTEEVNPDFVLNVTETFDIEKLKTYKLPIIIDFGASYCPPCRQMSPYLRGLNNDYQGKAIIRYVDIEKYPNYAENYPMEFIPTQLLICSDGTPYAPTNAEELGMQFLRNENGEHIATLHVGLLTMEQMKTMLKEMGLNE